MSVLLSIVGAAALIMVSMACFYISYREAIEPYNPDRKLAWLFGAVGVCALIGQMSILVLL